MRRAALAALGLLTLGGCWRDTATAFPPGLEPLEVNQVPEEMIPDGIAPSEPFRILTGATDAFHWTHVRAYVSASPAATWTALQTPEVVVDRRQVASWSVTQGVEEGFDVSFKVHNTVHQILNVDFDITWRQSVLEGTKDAPDVVAIRFQKTYGTPFIDLLAGSIVVRRLRDDLTELEMVEHLKAASNEDAAASYLKDLYASVSAAARGEPLPTY